MTKREKAKLARLLKDALRLRTIHSSVCYAGKIDKQTAQRLIRNEQRIEQRLRDSIVELEK